MGTACFLTQTARSAWGGWSEAAAVLGSCQGAGRAPGARALQGLAVGFYSNGSPFRSQVLLIQKSVTQHLACEQAAHRYLGLSDEILLDAPAPLLRAL